jgi:hypothetical protein
MPTPPATASGEAPATRVRIQHLPKLAPTPPLRPSLPIGVAVLALLLGLASVVVLLAGALVLLNVFLGGAIVPTTLFIATTIDPWGAAILIVLGAALLAIARALWDLERWSLYVSVGGAFLGLTYLFFTGSVTVLFLLLLGIFVYLLTVRHHFY